MEDEEVHDELINQVLELDLISLLGDGNEGGAETDGKIVRIHHVLIRELGQVVEEGEEVAHDDEDGAGPRLHHVADFDHKLVLRFKFWKKE